MINLIALNWDLQSVADCLVGCDTDNITVNMTPDSHNSDITNIDTNYTFSPLPSSEGCDGQASRRTYGANVMVIIWVKPVMCVCVWQPLLAII